MDATLQYEHLQHKRMLVEQERLFPALKQVIGSKVKVVPDRPTTVLQTTASIIQQLPTDARGTRVIDALDLMFNEVLLSRFSTTPAFLFLDDFEAAISSARRHRQPPRSPQTQKRPL